MVNRVLKYPHVKAVEFIPTFYWYDIGPENPPEGFDPSCDPSKIDLSSYYCYNRFNATKVSYWCYQRSEDGNCPEVTRDEMDQFSTKLGDCMTFATSNGLDISINARVDDGRKLEGEKRERGRIKVDVADHYLSYFHLLLVLHDRSLSSLAT